MEITDEQLRSNLKSIQKRIADACQRAGRDPSEVKLIAVSKTKPIHDIEVLEEAGQLSFGENYVQELHAKQTELSRNTEWHMIGHLQRNKVRYLIGTVALIHSVDSIVLVEQIEKEAAKKNRTMNILMEINIAEEETKWGFRKEEAETAAEQIAAFPHLRLKGLMTSAPKTNSPEANRIYFRNMKSLADQIARQKIPGVSMGILSMGMTQDFEIAIEEGSTMVRIGTGIFGERTYSR